MAINKMRSGSYWHGTRSLVSCYLLLLEFLLVFVVCIQSSSSLLLGYFLGTFISLVAFGSFFSCFLSRFGAYVTILLLIFGRILERFVTLVNFVQMRNDIHFERE